MSINLETKKPEDLIKPAKIASDVGELAILGGGVLVSQMVSPKTLAFTKQWYWNDLLHIAIGLGVGTAGHYGKIPIVRNGGAGIALGGIIDALRNGINKISGGKVNMTPNGTGTPNAGGSLTTPQTPTQEYLI